MTNRFRKGLWLTTALTATAILPAQAWAQDAAEEGGLEEIIVTAQKREQSVQDIPIAVTAVSEASLQANRIYTVNDLSSIAPGLTVKPSAGGISTPAFTMRGQVSFGVVAGSDKQVSVYVDGVYISAPRGSIFDLPDIQRLEVLRGPQGTLFGRNATAGAVSITTRDPGGEMRARIEGTVGNYDAYRIRATVETPQFGPFSALFSYVRNYRRGEIENAQAGLAWDRTNTGDPLFGKKTTSARWLGTVDSNSYFAAVKFEPSDTFKMVYKYDRNDDNGTPEGTAIAAYNRNPPAAAGGALLGNVLTALYTSNNVHFNPSAQRPDIVDNGWAIPRQQRVQGHSLTATWKATDSITVKNIAAYRKAFVFAPSSIDGVSTLTVTPAAVVPLGFLFAAGQLGAGFFALPADQQLATATAFGTPVLGQRIAVIASQASSIAKQYSDEIIVNYSSEKLQATLGGIWFHSDDVSGGPTGQQNTLQFPAFISPTGVIPLGKEGRSFNKATSLAAYLQLEYKVTPELELVAGGRITHDKKTSQFRWDTTPSAALPLGVPTNIIPGAFSKTKPNFQIGVNYTPNSDTLLYAKYSTSFVSGGQVAGIAYEPETAKSWEVGLKADFLDRKLRTNLALFHVTYDHFQSPQGTSSGPSGQLAIGLLTSRFLPANPTPAQQATATATATALASALSTFVIDQGTIKAKGFELEVTAAPQRGMILGGSVGFTDVKYPFINPIVLAANAGVLRVTARPKWTVSLHASYETQPLFDDATLQFRMDGQYRSSINFSANPAIDLYADNSNAAAVLGTKGFWLMNGRVALKHLKIGPADAEIAFWGKNITNRKDATFALALGPLGASNNFLPPRTFGLDLSLDF